MTAPLTSVPAGAPRLHFSCGRCGTVLSVPAALAGVRGPCPTCRHVVAAPMAVDHPAVVSPAPASARPPLVFASANQAPTVPHPSLPRPAAKEALVPEPEKRSPLRHARQPSPVREAARSRPRRPAEEAKEESPSEKPQATRTSHRTVTTGAVGAVLGGGLVFALLSAAHLRRDLSPAPSHPTQTPPASAQPATAPVRADDAITALAEHKKETARDLRDLLEAQEVVWRFFAAPTAEDAMPWVAANAAPPLPARGLQSPLAAVTLRHKHRLTPDGGLASQWTVATTRFGELVVDVTDTSGKPRVVWDTLALQLGASTTSPERHTAATP